MHSSKSRRVSDRKLRLYDQALELWIRGYTEREIGQEQGVGRTTINARLKRGREMAGKLSKIHAEKARDISMLRIDRGRKLNDVDLRVENPSEPIREVGKVVCKHCGEEGIEELQSIVEYLALREQWESECSSNAVRRSRAWEKLIKAEKRVAEMLGTDAPKELAVFDATMRQLQEYTAVVKRAALDFFPARQAHEFLRFLEGRACEADGVAPPAVEVKGKVIEAVEVKGKVIEVEAR